mmetsp:Transcript_18255/g.59952  ORF Transcript_18255/g.59952 Transcript_18255/m.59952 type:complete len:679 (-) Transcript_18255:2186-4222(-)
MSGVCSPAVTGGIGEVVEAGGAAAGGETAGAPAGGGAGGHEQESELDRKIVRALQDFLRGREWVDITTPRQINEACSAIVKGSGVSLQKLNKKLKKGSWREKLTNFISRFPSTFALDTFENNFCVRLRHDETEAPAPPAAQHNPQLASPQLFAGGYGQLGRHPPSGSPMVAQGGVKTPEEQVIELIKALLRHLKSSEGKDWVDITNMPKAAHMMQRKPSVVGVSLRWGSRDVGPEEWQRLMAEIRTKHGKLANFLSKHPEIFELRNRPGGKDIRLVAEQEASFLSSSLHATAAAVGQAEASGKTLPAAAQEATDQLTLEHGVAPLRGRASRSSGGRGVEAKSSSSSSSWIRFCDNCGKQGHTSAVCSLPPQCHVCGSVRHSKKDCPKRTERCSLCGRVGHLKVKCRTGVTAMRSSQESHQMAWGAWDEAALPPETEKLPPPPAAQVSLLPSSPFLSRFVPEHAAAAVSSSSEHQSQQGSCWVLLETRMTLSTACEWIRQHAVTSSWRVKGVFSSRDAAIQNGRVQWVSQFGTSRGWEPCDRLVPVREERGRWQELPASYPPPPDQHRARKAQDSPARPDWSSSSSSPYTSLPPSALLPPPPLPPQDFLTANVHFSTDLPGMTAFGGVQAGSGEFLWAAKQRSPPPPPVLSPPPPSPPSSPILYVEFTVQKSVLVPDPH